MLPQLKKGLSALVYTQVSDVEDEVNGLFTYDRAAIKPDPAAVRAVNQALEAAFEKIVESKKEGCYPVTPSVTASPCQLPLGGSLGVTVNGESLPLRGRWHRVSDDGRSLGNSLFAYK